MVSIPTVSVVRPSQLELGAYYLIKGNDHLFLPIPPQVFRLERKMIYSELGEGWISGTLWWRMWNQGRMEKDHQLTLYQINVPDRGLSDIHLERIPDHLVRQIVAAPAYREVQQEQQAKIQRALKAIKPRFKIAEKDGRSPPLYRG